MAHTHSRLILAQHLRQPPPPTPLTVLLSVKLCYAELIQSGEKRVEFRRRFPRSFHAGRAIFYVSSPTRAICLTAQITAVYRGPPRSLWRRFARAGATGAGEFDAYFRGASAGVALLLSDVRPLRRPIALNDPRLAAIAFRPPQSLAVLRPDSRLPELISSSASPHPAPVLRA